MIDKIGCVVIWFNPSESCVCNILTYLNVVDKLCIVDNSTNDNIELLQDIDRSKIIYIPNYENYGIARALNIGCELLVNDGYQWCMTMDQDSSWETHNLDIYIENSKEKSKLYDNIKSFCPSFHMEESVLRTIKNKFLKVKGKAEFSFVKRCICSGNIIELNEWKLLGGFNETLFIDEVDHEYCFRLCKHGFQILQFNNIFMNHVLGTPRRTLIGFESHSPIRVYYIFRNMFYVMEKYPEYAKEFEYKKSIRKKILSFFIHFQIKKIMYAWKGYVDYKKICFEEK